MLNKYYDTKDIVIYKGDALSVLKELPTESVDCVITSPPYWSLRDYKVEGQLGIEKTFKEYILKLCDIFDEIKRVLKKGGTCWVNIGDTYYSEGTELRQKNLCNIPARFSVEMQNRGWILRNEIIWWKRSCMPSSVKDRFNMDFEKIFFFTKNEDYYFETQYEPLSEATVKDILKRKNLAKGDGSKDSKHFGLETPYSNISTDRSRLEFCDLEKGRHKRCVWDVPTKPFKEAHFGAYPEKLVEPMINAGCPEYICVKCKQPEEKIYKNLANNDNIQFGKYGDGHKGLAEGTKRKCPDDYQIKQTFLGYKECNCKVEFESGVVLDPFAGAFTTGVVAKRLKRKFIGIELNETYIKEIAIPRLENTLKGLF